MIYLYRIDIIDCFYDLSLYRIDIGCIHDLSIVSILLIVFMIYLSRIDIIGCIYDLSLYRIDVIACV